METPFERLDRDTRDEWREHPVTQAFLGTLVGLRTSGVNQLVETIKTLAEDDDKRLAHIGGRLAAVDDVLLIVRRP